MRKEYKISRSKICSSNVLAALAHSIGRDFVAISVNNIIYVRNMYMETLQHLMSLQ